MNARNALEDLKLGMLVYRKGFPQVPGKLLKIGTEDALGCRQCHVYWINGEESQISDNLLRDYSKLIEATDKLVKSYRANQKKLEAL